MVDLSKLKPGDTVHFRCGGKAVVLFIRLKDPEQSYKYGVILKNSSNERLPENILPPVGFYQIGGTLRGTNVEDPLDIIRIEPAFRWEDVKPGMAFVYDKTAAGGIYLDARHFEDGDIVIFLCKSPEDPDDVWFKSKTMRRASVGCICDFIESEKEGEPILTRAPEHDIRRTK